MSKPPADEVLKPIRFTILPDAVTMDAKSWELFRRRLREIVQREARKQGLDIKHADYGGP